MTDDIRTFDTGATRGSEEGKFDYEGFLSPLVLRRYAEHMHKHRVQADGTLRDSDKWQKGVPLDVYMKSMWRHFMDLWKHHRGYIGTEQIEESLCAIIFNASGYLHELQVHPDRDKDWVKRADEELSEVLGSHADDVDETLDCMPAPTKESLAALGTAEAILAIDGAKDPGYVLTPEGWKLNEKAEATPASNPVGFKADDYVHAASGVKPAPASDRADLKPMVPGQAKEFRRMKPSRKTALNVEAAPAGDPNREPHSATTQVADSLDLKPF